VIERALTGGSVVTEGRIRAVDVLIEGDKIVALTSPGGVELPPTTEVVDVTGSYVLPGMIDVHVHLREPGYTHKEDITTGTAAAAAGGVTTVFGMPNVKPPTSTSELLEDIFETYAAKSIVDWNHNALPSQLDQVEKLADAGIAAFKIYMVVDTGRDYPHPSGTGIHDHGHLLQMFEAIRPTGLPFMIHPHDQAIMDVVEQSFWARGDRSPQAYAKTLATHDGLIWDSAIGVLLHMSEATGTPLHIVHMQTGGAVRMVRDAKARGVPVSCEVNHWALFLSRWSDVETLGPYALSYWVADHHRDVLWDALRDGTIDMLASDHAPHTREEKDIGWEDCWACHTGTPGIEEQYTLLLDEAAAGRMTLPDVTRIVAEAPAQSFHLADKGVLRPGADADIVVYDPARPGGFSNDRTLSRCGWTPYDGRATTGTITRTMVRGRDVYVDGDVVGRPGWGRLARPSL
jgi:dihydroorotase (multifunctional complex type)